MGGRHSTLPPVDRTFADRYRWRSHGVPGRRRVQQPGQQLAVQVVLQMLGFDRAQLDQVQRVAQGLYEVLPLPAAGTGGTASSRHCGGCDAGWS